MIYDQLNNIDTYSCLSPDLYEGLKFLRQASPDFAVGSYQISPRVKAIVSEYETKLENELRFEAHRKNIDIQVLLLGEERIACMPIEKIMETMPYDEDNDAAFYSADTIHHPSNIILLPGLFAIFFPQDGHMPCLCVDDPKTVKKVVVKVAIE